MNEQGSQGVLNQSLVLEEILLGGFNLRGICSRKGPKRV